MELIMKAFWSVLAKVLFVVVLIQAWFLYDFYNKSQFLIVDKVLLEQQLLAASESLVSANEALVSANGKIELLEKSSLENVLKETNKAVVNSWEALLNTVEGELNKARKSIDSTIEELRQELPAEDDKLDGESRQEPSTIIKGERT